MNQNKDNLSELLYQYSLESNPDIKEQLKKQIKDIRIQNILDYFNTLEPFNGNVEKVPSIPVVSREQYLSVIIPNLIRCGAIPKNQLKVGVTYLGDCRNSNTATWNGKIFIYKRYKWGSSYEDEIQHFEDGADIDTDVFVPIQEIQQGN